jgi:hypothetical protein
MKASESWPFSISSDKMLVGVKRAEGEPYRMNPL